MKITVELPDSTITGFVNFVYGDEYGLSLGTIAIDSEHIKNGEATWRSCKKVKRLSETEGKE